MIRTCRECFEDYVANPSVRLDNGFCSDECERQYDELNDDTKWFTGGL